VGHCINLPKPTCKTIWVESFPPSSLEWYCSSPKNFNYLVIPHLDPKLPYVLIQINEGKEKLDTLMVEGYGKTQIKL
jgi:hypothetical protein